MANTPQLKQIATDTLGAAASEVLMNRIFVTLDQTPDPRTAAAKIEKLVALFLGAEHATALRRRFDQALG